MKASGIERGILWVAAVVLLAAGGCTNSEVIGTSTGGVGVTVEAQGGAGRYDLGNFTISQIFLRLADPNQQGSLGEPIGLLGRPVDIDLNNPDVVSAEVGAPPEATAALSEGTYAVVMTTTSQFTLHDEPPPDYGTTCPQMVDILAIAPNVTQPSNTDVEFQTPALLEISAAEAAELTMGVITAMEPGAAILITLTGVLLLCRRAAAVVTWRQFLCRNLPPICPCLKQCPWNP